MRADVVPAMLQNPRRSAMLFRDFNNLQFAGVLGMVLFVILLLFMADTAPDYHRGISVDLPKAAHPVPMRGAEREDAMLVALTRDGHIFFGRDLVTPDLLADRIQEHLNGRGVERKVYIKADMRARWGSVKPVLDAARSAGVIRVAFLADQRRASGPAR
jgi:biopolymer transport protein TolR